MTKEELWTFILKTVASIATSKRDEMELLESLSYDLQIKVDEIEDQIDKGEA